MAAPLPAGTRVALRHDVDRYPHFLAPAGATGEVLDIGDPDVFAVVLDETLPGAEDWDNAILWSLRDGDEPLRDLAVDPAALGIDTTKDGWLDEYERATRQERAYEAASADVVLALTRDEANTIAEILGDVAGSDFLGENGDYQEVARLRDLILRTEGVH